MDGSTVHPPTIIEVALFDRGQEIQDKATAYITKHFATASDCLSVYFIPLKENNYYENSEHFQELLNQKRE